MLTPKYFIKSQKRKRTLKEIKTCQNCCVRVQDKGSRFVVISNDEYCEKVNTQVGRSSFTRLPHDITKSFQNKVKIILRNGKTLERKNGLTISNLTIVNLEQCMN